MIKKGWCIYTRETLKNGVNNQAFELMQSAASSHGLHVDIIFEEDLSVSLDSGNIQIYHQHHLVDELPTFILLRSYCLQISPIFEALGIKVFNSTESLKQAKNKWLSHLLFTRHGIPTPKTLLGDGLGAGCSYAFIQQQLGSPFVLKGLFGMKGEQVHLVDNQATFDRLVQQFNRLGESFLAQSFIASSAGRDVRVHVIGNQAIVGIERIAETGFKSNYALGGQSREYPLTEAMKNLAVKATQAIGLDIAGVDILLSEEGPVICEVNGISAFRTVTLNTDINLPEKIFQHILENFET